jgi:arylformamidase
VRHVDLSHVIEEGMITYPGLPGPTLRDHMSREASRKHYAPGTEFSIKAIDLVVNTGTYVDSPFHRYEDGADVAALPLASLAGAPGVVVRTRGRTGRAIGVEAFFGLEVAGRAVLVDTGWAAHWRTPAYFTGHPFLTADAAHALVDRGALLVGIDSLNIDSTDDPERPVHTILLGAGLPIVEHMTNLEELPDQGFAFHAVPAPVRGVGTFPVRAFAVI